jgi:hypothetical protein
MINCMLERARSRCVSGLRPVEVALEKAGRGLEADAWPQPRYDGLANSEDEEQLEDRTGRVPANGRNAKESNCA